MSFEIPMVQKSVALSMTWGHWWIWSLLDVCSSRYLTLNDTVVPHSLFKQGSNLVFFLTEVHPWYFECLKNEKFYYRSWIWYNRGSLESYFSWIRSAVWSSFTSQRGLKHQGHKSAQTVAKRKLPQSMLLLQILSIRAPWLRTKSSHTKD